MKCQTNQFNCPVEATLSLIGGKYKPLILWHLIDHPLHYMELQRLIPNATLHLDRASYPFWTRCASGETAIWVAWMCRRHAVKAANKMLA